MPTRLFYYSGGISPMVALVLLLLQLLVATSVGARPSGQALLGGDPQDCDTFIKNNVLKRCENEANSKFPGTEQVIHCEQDYYIYQCETKEACKSCSSNSIAKWIQDTQHDMDHRAQDGACQTVEKPPPLFCPTTPPPTTNLTTTTTTKLPTTTKAGFPMWIIAVVIVVVITILGAIAVYFFLCRKSKSPKPNKSSRRLGSSAPVVRSSTANEDADAGGAVPSGPSGAVAGPSGPSTGASVGRAATGPSGGPPAGVGAAAGGRDTREAQGSRRKHKKSSRRGKGSKGSKGSRRSKRESKKSLAKKANSKLNQIPPRALTKSGGRACPVMQKIRAQMRAEENEAKAKMQQAKAQQGKQMARPPTKYKV